LATFKAWLFLEPGTGALALSATAGSFTATGGNTAANTLTCFFVS
jgi:hypothetical protein